MRLYIICPSAYSCSYHFPSPLVKAAPSSMALPETRMLCRSSPASSPVAGTHGLPRSNCRHLRPDVPVTWVHASLDRRCPSARRHCKQGRRISCLPSCGEGHRGCFSCSSVNSSFRQGMCGGGSAPRSFVHKLVMKQLKCNVRRARESGMWYVGNFDTSAQ